MLGHALLALMAVVQMDQTVQVQRGTKLDVNNFAGEVAIKTWEKDAVRVEVNHSDRETIDLKQADQTLAIRSRSLRGAPQRSLDYTITVPTWMAINVAGTYTDVTMDGVGGDVAVDAARGDIKVRGGSGIVSLKSVQGEVTLEKAKGHIEVRALNESIHLADISGDLSAETTNGSIVLDRIDSGNVDLYTVNGNISYDGALKDKGIYRMTTHNGLVAVAVGEKANATLLVRTYNGGFKSTFPVKLDDQNPRKRFTLTFGNGSARVELESFGGTIALRRPGEPRPETERKHTRGGGQAHVRMRDRMDLGDGIDAFVDGLVSEVVSDAVGDTVDLVVTDVVTNVATEVATHVAEHVRVSVHPTPHPTPKPTPR